MSDAIPSPAEITQILHSWRSGSREALERLIPLVHKELSALASRQLSREWRHGRLQTTSVVNEAYMKLIVRSGGKAMARSEFMPAWGDELTDEQITDVVTYLGSINSLRR